MPVDPVEIAELQRAFADEPQVDTSDMAALESIAMMIAFTVAHARSEGWPEVDTVETLVRASDLTPHDVRTAEAILRPLGYRDVCARLRVMAGRRKRDLVPLPVGV